MTENAPIVGRFAPSPTGVMHAGNIFAALVNWLIVKSSGGRMVLRIEDLDPARSKPEFTDRIQRDFEALGLFWDEGPYFQSGRSSAYRAAFEAISAKIPVYECFCTRAELNALSAPHAGERAVYAGTCRHLSDAELAKKREAGRAGAWRVAVPDKTVCVCDLIQGSYCQNLAHECGDFLIKRADGAFAYQLAVVVDDAAQGVNMVVRGQDLLSSVPQQMFLQSVLGALHPQYAHHPLLVNAAGRRLSKRDKDAGLDELMAKYGSAQAIIGHIAKISGLISEDAPTTPEELLKNFQIETLPTAFKNRKQILWE